MDINSLKDQYAKLIKNARRWLPSDKIRHLRAPAIEKASSSVNPEELNNLCAMLKDRIRRRDILYLQRRHLNSLRILKAARSKHIPVIPEIEEGTKEGKELLRGKRKLRPSTKLAVMLEHSAADGIELQRLYEIDKAWCKKHHKPFHKIPDLERGGMVGKKAKQLIISANIIKLPNSSRG